MLTTPSQKQHISLSDYNYKKDIDYRIWLSERSALTIDLLREAVYGPLKTSVQELADALELSPETLFNPLQELADGKILKVDGNKVEIDKEHRKYFERRIEIFEENFKPGIPFIRDLLSRVPISAIPTWYSLPRMTSSIFDSIVERYLQTPRIFEQYLMEDALEDPIQIKIWEAVMSAPKLLVPAKWIQKEFSISPEEFQEAMLNLEFRFFCCVSYQKNGDRWEEVVTPFAEWRALQRHLLESLEKPSSIETIKSEQEDPFSYINQLAKLLELLKNGANSVSDPKLLDKLIDLHFIAQEHDLFTITDEGSDWLSMTPGDKATTLYRHHSSRTESDREYRMVEKALQRVMNFGWTTLSSFLNNIVEPIGNAQAIELKCVSRGEWAYELPQLNTEQKDVVERIICNSLKEAGIVICGENNGERCFTVSPFGKMLLA